MGSRKSLNVPGRAHRGGNIPMGSKIGNVVYSSGIGGGFGQEPEGQAPDLDRHAKTMFENMKEFMETAGGSLDDIIFVMLLLKNRESRDFIDKYWLEAFPDEASRPARHALQTELGGGAQMQALITAVIE
jgi:2-iminobutanoate/2-iminopropanoate deaminase